MLVKFTSIKPFRNKYHKWLYWNIYWRIWMIWRPLLLSKIFLGIAISLEYITLSLTKNKDRDK
jgi:hypothetical protein